LVYGRLFDGCVFVVRHGLRPPASIAGSSPFFASIRHGAENGPYWTAVPIHTGHLFRR